MDPSSVQQPQLQQITCTTCGKRFRYRAELAGRMAKCACGARIIIPRVQLSAEPSPAPAARPAPAVGLAARAGAADQPFDEDEDDADLAPAAAAPAAPITVHLPPQRKGLTQEA